MHAIYQYPWPRVWWERKEISGWSRALFPKWLICSILVTVISRAHPSDCLTDWFLYKRGWWDTKGPWRRLLLCYIFVTQCGHNGGEYHLSVKSISEDMSPLNGECTSKCNTRDISDWVVSYLVAPRRGTGIGCHCYSNEAINSHCITFQVQMLNPFDLHVKLETIFMIINVSILTTGKSYFIYLVLQGDMQTDPVIFCTLSPRI